MDTALFPIHNWLKRTTITWITKEKHICKLGSGTEIEKAQDWSFNYCSVITQKTSESYLVIIIGFLKSI